jgi:hypothetical protein
MVKLDCFPRLSFSPTSHLHIFSSLAIVRAADRFALISIYDAMLPAI